MDYPISRNTRVRNDHNAPIAFKATHEPGKFSVIEFTLLPGEYKDICHRAFCIEGNSYGQVKVCAFLEGAMHKEEETYILPYLVRDSTILVLNCKNGRVTVDNIKGNLVGRIRFVVKLRDMRKKLFGSQEAKMKNGNNKLKKPLLLHG